MLESSSRVLSALRVGEERTFEQDPAFALRVLADIALRAVAPAVNDPTTAVQALDAMDDLLRALATRDLDIMHVRAPDGAIRVSLVLPTWPHRLASNSRAANPRTEASSPAGSLPSTKLPACSAISPPAGEPSKIAYLTLGQARARPPPRRSQHILDRRTFARSTARFFSGERPRGTRGRVRFTSLSRVCTPGRAPTPVADHAWPRTPRHQP